MTDKRKLKCFQGKKRICVEVASAPGISRFLSWDESRKEYLPPRRGKSYYARRYLYFNGIKKRETSFFDTLDEAREWQDSSKRDLLISSKTVQGSSSSNSPLLAEVIEKWKTEEWPNLRENTKIQYAKCLKFYDSLLGVPIEDIRPSVLDSLIAEWCKDLKKYKKIRTSFIKELETLTYIFGWYQKNYDDAQLVYPVKERHFKRIKIRNSKVARKKYMTDDEAELFLNALRKDSFHFYVLAFVQMKQLMRISEACALKWSNLDFAQKKYTLVEHVVWPRIGGAKAYLELGTKNIRGGETYELNLFTEVVEVLKQIERTPECDFIFHQDGELLTYRQVQYRFDKAFRAAKLPFRSTHVLRHSGATAFYNSTSDLLALQQMGTWSNSKMPQHYAKVLSAKAKDAIEKMERRKRHLKVVS